MSTNPSPELKSLFEAALNEFEKRAGTNLIQHQIIDKLVNCGSADSVIEVLQEQAQAFRNFRGDDGKLMTWLKRTVNVLYTLSTSDVLREDISLPFPPAKTIFAGLAILLGSIKDIGTSYDALVDLFESFESFLGRLDIYTKIPSTTAITEIIIKILIELLSTISLAIQQAKQGRLKKLGKKFLGGNDVEANIKIVLDGGSVLMDDVHQTLVLIEQLTGDMIKARRDQLQESFRRWLSPPDPSKNYNIARETYHEGSAKWFVHGNTFSEWKRTGSLLWIHGKPHDNGSKEPSKDALKECLKSMLSLQDQGPIFIILDAIDECPNSTGCPSPRENVLEFVGWLSELHYTHVSICVTSRPEVDIEDALLPLASHTVSLHGEGGQREDIVNYIKWFIKSDPKARKWRKEDKELVLERLSEGADGM
ncbi:hypothetical protein BJV77DRAFT_1067265 [Russula vinacea]|nr:hypothetical protein BJV77DRAFT_1067265 [Russula vinacea]